MKMKRTSILGLAVAAAIATVGLTGASAQAASDAKTLDVPEEHRAMGTVYYVMPGKPGDNADQIRFSNEPPKSTDPVDTFTGYSNSVIGYVVLGSGGTADIVAGEFRLPVDSLDSGIPLRNKHTRSKKWLFAKKHPNIIFKLSGVSGIKSVSGGTGDSYEGTIAGEMTIKGGTSEMSVPAKITLVSGTARGDLLRIQATYSVSLSDFGVKNGIVGKKVANEIQLEQYLVLSTTRPE